MKIVFRTVLFHIICILVFTFIYSYISDHFESNNDNKKYNNFIDFLLFSTTIQAGVGISDLYPISLQSKIALIIQQIIMIMTHVFTIYMFTPFL